tara:strand:+ start:106 stop:1011 length:906 start_codon:yes stop_codon:yes gene_type:complete
MKIFITNKLIDGPTGGGNQFLKALKSQFAKKGLCTEDPLQADVVLFNSHQNLELVHQIKEVNQKAKFVHRLDGPMRLYNNMSDQRDYVAYQMNTDYADAVVFQSEWSKQANIKLGLDISGKKDTVIHNAPDPGIFYPSSKKQKNDKIRLIASSWSDNIRKGFFTYKYLDETLDFDKYEFFFMGRSPVGFENIVSLGALSSHEVANELRKSDIFITASENDPCSNSLIEALSCGLPALALKSGGHPELIGQNGLFYNRKEEIVNKLEDICDNYLNFKHNIEIESILSTGDRYIEFFTHACNL